MHSLANRDSFFQIAGGTLAPDAPSYVERPADRELLQLILDGEYCNVLTARQTGKSSLMVRTADRLKRRGARTAVVDISGLGASLSPDQWYLGILRLIREGLGLDADELAWWNARLRSSFVQRFTWFIQDQVLGPSQDPVVLFFDEIDSTLTLKFTDDFFAGIRAMYNERATTAAFKRLTVVLLGVARAADLIEDHQGTPYNIGQTIDLSDFGPRDARTLLPGLESVFPDQAEAILTRVLYWTGGHPYLTQQICGTIALSRRGVWLDEQIDGLVERLFFREGRVKREINLERIDDYIRQSRHRDAMLRTYKEILSGRSVMDEERSIEKSHLKLSGIVRATPTRQLQVRNRIYERVFGLTWVSQVQRSSWGFLRRLLNRVRR